MPDGHRVAEHNGRGSRPSLGTAGASRLRQQGGNMLYYALLFLIVAIVAGLLGFGAIAFAAAGLAKILFFIFIVLFLVSLVAHLTRGRSSGV
jgi:uncharacterized membrane protein YtjA (UPF0391 family)